MPANLSTAVLEQTAPCARAASAVNSTSPHITLSSDTLLRGQKSVEIIHNGTAYRLQATKLGKLILTK